MVGRTLAHYRILDKLGEGGMGEVYLARDTRLKRQVALKILPAEAVSQPKRRQRFRREAEIVASLNHPGIVSIYSLEEADGIHFLTMEVVKGKSLDKIIPKSGLDREQFFELAVPLAEALAVAHEEGVTHRDLKPANVMLTDDGQVKILDFGLAKLRRDGEEPADATQDPTEALTREGQVVGTLPYMAPEQVEGKVADHRSDIFSLGSILYEMASGRRPFRGRSPAELVSSILRDSPGSVADLRDDLPNHLGRIIRHCQEKDPSRRFQTARDVKNELLSLQEEVTTVERAAPAAPRPPRRGRLARPLVLSGAAVLVALLALAGLWLRERAGRGSPFTIAVLPFVNLTGDSGQDYLAEGLSAGLITRLAEITGLEVVSRSEAWSYRDRNLPATELAKRLGVQAVLEGDLKGERGRLQASVTLIDGRTGRVLVSERLEAEEAFRLEKKMAERLIEVLSIPLSLRERRRLARDPTGSARAYDYYLQAQQLLESVGDPGSIRAAADLFRQAVRLDPGFALAYAGLSEALWKSYQRERDPELLAEAERQAERSVDLDPELPAALVALARVHRSTGRHAASIAELQQVLASHPKPDEAQRELAFAFEQAGDLDQAEACLRAAVALGPEEWFNWNALGIFLGRAGRLSEAREAFGRAAALAPPEVTWPQENLALVALTEGDFEGAIEALEGIEAPSRDPDLAATMGTAYFFTGDLEKAERFYRLAVELAPRNFLNHGDLGDLYERTGRKEEALDHYRIALDLVGEALLQDPGDSRLRLDQALYAAKARECADAVAQARGLEEALPRGAENAHVLAQVYALCGERDRALEALRAAFALGLSPKLVREEDEFAPLRGDPEFEAITRTSA